MITQIDFRRIRLLGKENLIQNGPIVYWMSRDQRVQDNWALLYAQHIAFEINQPLHVVFCLIPHFLGATFRQYNFMLKGLEEVEQTLEKLNICFEILLGDPADVIIKYIAKNNVGTLVIDFSPLKISRLWKEKITKECTIPFFEVDTHNIVPCFFTSNKQEYSAYTFRRKIQKILAEFLTEFPKVQHDRYAKKKHISTDWQKIYNVLKNKEEEPISWFIPGEKAAHKVLKDFIDNRLHNYENTRNDPTKNGQSNLSPYLHFGHISAQRIALEIGKIGKNRNTKNFLEELIVRKELADNFCFYNTHYDSVKCFPAWAQKTLKIHQKDKRKYVYTLKQFEYAKTHDQLWNAAQKEMLITGKMHGFMRMYWAKKILEWTKNPKDAMKFALYLNDTYSLDGRDPNGYVGILWSLGGVHDRAFKERPIFGKIRYMNEQGCKKKFNVDKYIEMIEHLEKQIKK